MANEHATPPHPTYPSRALTPDTDLLDSTEGFSTRSVVRTTNVTRDLQPTELETQSEISARGSIASGRRSLLLSHQSSLPRSSINTASDDQQRLLSRVKRYWGRHVSVAVPHERSRDHLGEYLFTWAAVSLERTFQTQNNV